VNVSQSRTNQETNQANFKFDKFEVTGKAFEETNSSWHVFDVRQVTQVFHIKYSQKVIVFETHENCYKTEQQIYS